MNLPDETRAFLSNGNVLEYNVAESEIGAVELKDADTLFVDEAQLLAGSFLFADLDPYKVFDDEDGYYRLPVVDLIAFSEAYKPQGLLVWFPKLHSFGSYDDDHGVVQVFEDVTWKDIEAEPQKYLDDQWQTKPIGKALQPWLHFEFHLPTDDLAFPVHAGTCELHEMSLEEIKGRRSGTQDARIARHMRDYLENRMEGFPFPGVPLNKSTLKACPYCRAAEQDWFHQNR